MTMQKLVSTILLCITAVAALPLNKSSRAVSRAGNFELPPTFVWNIWDVLTQGGNWHPQLFDEWDRNDQDSPIAALFQTMLVFDDKGVPHKPRGVKPSRKTSVKITELDRHLEAPKSGQRRKKRNFLTTSTLWENKIVPYTIQTGFSAQMNNGIQEGIQDFHDMTCLQFVPNSQRPSLPHNTHIAFVNGQGCSSYVGRTSFTAQQVTLQDPQCAETKTVIHELMHAIGQMHEQQRTDRDQYIEILSNNIPSNAMNNFDISNTHDRTPYDVESIMQYPLTSFSQNGGKTMKLKDTRLEVLIDTAKTFTHNDIKEITLAYQCTESCTSPPSCQNEGFVAHTCQCLCPSELTGSTCEQVQTDTGCGGVINLNSGQQHIVESPNYPNTVTTDKECVWLIRGPTGSNIKLDIQELDLARNNFNSECHHWIEIRYNMIGQSGIRQCNTVNNQVYTTTNDGERNLMLVKFDSRIRKDIQSSQGQKFKLQFTAEGGSSSNPCDPNPCLNSGTCTVIGSTYDCACTASWTGSICDVLVQSCQPNPCQNGGTCSIIGNSVSCDCPPNWGGPNCETSTVVTTTTTTTTVSPPTGSTHLCDFETNSCWMNAYGAIYIRSGSWSVEPSYATEGTSRYAFIYPGASFILRSPDNFLSDKDYCFELYYYMNGSSPYLEVYHLNSFQQTENLYSYSQNTSGSWHNIQLPFHGHSADKLTIYGQLGYSFFGGVLALDQIRLTDGSC